MMLVRQSIFLIVDLFLCFEYLAMLNIINQQKRRSVEQILYDHNAENLEEHISFTGKGKLNYRKMENLQMIFHIIMILYTFFFYFCPIIFENHIDPKITSFIEIYFHGSLIAILSLLFLLLQGCMFKYHWYEFHASKRVNFSIFFVVQLRNVIHLGSLLIFHNLFLNVLKDKFYEFWYNYHVIPAKAHMLQMSCEYFKEHQGQHFNHFLWLLGMHLTPTFEMALLFLILYLKSDKDPI